MIKNTPLKKLSVKLTALDSLLILGILTAILWLAYRCSFELNYHYQWQKALNFLFTPSADHGLPYFFQGLIATIRLSLWGIVFALILGVPLGFARFSKNTLLNAPATAYVLLIRNIPPLVFVFIFYFFISSQLIPVLGLESLLREHSGHASSWQVFFFGRASLWENLLSGVICIGMLSAAYIAEIVRAGLAAIPKGQWEASQSLGLSSWVTFSKIIFPQVFIAIAPALAGQTISLVKDSSIVSIISIQEITFVGTEIANSSGYVTEIWVFVGLSYLLLCLLLSRLFRWLEKRSARHLGV